MADWRTELLEMVGAKPTPQNLRFLKNWQRWEGGHTKNDARFNWLNTTMDAPGVVREINPVGVKAFNNRQNGVNALAATLLNGRYNDIVRAFRAGDPFSHDVTAGLSTWVSGSPTGNPSYAQKILGVSGKGRVSQYGKSAQTGSKPSPIATPGPLKIDMEPLYAAFADDPEFVELLRLAQPKPRLVKPSRVRQKTYTTPGGTTLKGTYVPSVNFRGTHITDGLDWNHGAKTAKDIVLDAGTPVGAPEDGVVLRWDPEGAQGGGSMWFRADSGHVYWLGHIADGLGPGTRVRRGQVIASISSDHKTPHLHIDKRTP